MQCAIHPDVETGLRCSKCGQLICPKCLVQTPVGGRCPKCANVRKLPVFEVTPIFYLRAVGAGLAISGALGALWPYIPYGGFFLLIVSAAIGYAIGEVISISVNRKRGRGLRVIAGVGMAIAYVVSYVVDDPSLGSLDRMLDMWGLIALGIGILVAVSRLR